jgi:hypothetical protein
MTWAGRIGRAIAIGKGRRYDMAMKVTEEKQAEIPVTAEVEQTVRERLETIEEDKKSASPWPDVKRRILSRHPQP